MIKCNAGSGSVPVTNDGLGTTLFTLAVTDSTANDQWPMRRFHSKRPKYLADLQGYCERSENSCNTENIAIAGGGGGGGRRSLQGRPRAPGDAPGAGVAGGGGCTINGQAFPGHGDGMQIATVPVGSVNDWTVTGNAGHPFHLHVNPYQLQVMTLLCLDMGLSYSVQCFLNAQGVTDNTGWFQTGDWHDVTYLGFGNVAVGTYRFSADTFTGEFLCNENQMSNIHPRYVLVPYRHLIVR